MSHFQINPYSFPTIPPPPPLGLGTWAEVGRNTLVAPSNNIPVTVSNKEYYMFLINIVNPAPDIQLNLQLGTGSVDTGLNYASRDSTGGLGDVTHASQDKIILSTNSVIPHEQFHFGYINNLEGYEKLVSCRGIQNEDGIDANYFRTQVAGKWSDTRPLDRINLFNAGTGIFPIGSELVVLGYSRFDDGLATNFWQLLAEKTAVGGEAVVVTPVFAKKKYLIVNYQISPNSGSQFAYQGRFGEGSVITTANSYQNRAAASGGGDPGNFADLAQQITTTGNSINYSNGFYLNRAGAEKLWFSTGTSDRIGAGPPEMVRVLQWGKQKDLTLKAGQIDVVNMHQYSGVGVIQAGSKVTVWGAD